MFKKNKKEEQTKQRHLITALNPKSPISEQYRTLRTNLQFSAVDNKLQTIVVTSAAPATGKSMTSANLAVAYAQQGMKTLLIDADLRKPTVQYTFRMNNLRGLSTALIGDIDFQDATQPASIDGLDVLTSGPIPPNPAELLGSKRMESLLDTAKDIYDIVIFDTPPALAVADAKILSSIADGVLFVVRSGVTKNEEAEKMYHAFKAANCRLLGVVLNDVSKANSDDYYYYYGS